MKHKNYHAIYQGGSYWFMTLQGAINAVISAGGGSVDIFNYPYTDTKIKTIIVEVKQ